MSKKVNENKNEIASHAEWLKLERLTMSSAADVRQGELEAAGCLPDL